MVEKLTQFLAELDNGGHLSGRVSKDDISSNPTEALRQIDPSYILQPKAMPDEIPSETVVTRHMIGSHRYTRQFDTRDLMKDGDCVSRCLAGMGVCDTDLLAYHRTRPNIGFAFFRAALDTGCSLLPLNPEDTPYDNIHGMYDLGATIWMCHENELLSYVATAGDNHIRFRDLQTIIAMTRFSESSKSKARSTLGSRISIKKMLMDASFGIIGYQCDNCRHDEYTIDTDCHFAEIVDENGHVSDGPGELVTTNMDRLSVPVIRARTGLIAERVEYECNPVEAWEPPSRIKIKGRVDRVTDIGGKSVRLSDLEKIPERARSASNRPVVTLRKTLVSTDEVSVHSPFYQDPTFRNLVQQTIADDDGLKEAISMESGHLVFEPYVGIDAAMETSSGVIDLREGAPILL